MYFNSNKTTKKTTTNYSDKLISLFPEPLKHFPMARCSWWPEQWGLAHLLRSVAFTTLATRSAVMNTPWSSCKIPAAQHVTESKSFVFTSVWVQIVQPSLDTGELEPVQTPDSIRITHLLHWFLLRIPSFTGLYTRRVVAVCEGHCNAHLLQTGGTMLGSAPDI